MRKKSKRIKKAKKYLDKNKCVAIPTETVYGLAANAYSDKAVKKIFHLKKRPKNNPLIVHYSGLSKLKDVCHVNNNFLNLYIISYYHSIIAMMQSVLLLVLIYHNYNIQML